MIKFGHKGNFSRTKRYLEKAKTAIKLKDLDKYGQAGVDALSSATPLDSGETAGSWYYDIERQNGKVSINFFAPLILCANPRVTNPLIT